MRDAKSLLATLQKKNVGPKREVSPK